MPNANPTISASPRPSSPKPLKANSPKPVKAKKASPKAGGTKEARVKAEAQVSALQEHVHALQSELELARVQLL